MEAPVLSKNQQNKALRKKNVEKKSIRNVLSKPTILNWPLVSQFENTQLKETLKELITYKYNTNIKWDDIKNFPKEDRRIVRKKILDGRKKMKPPPEYLKYVMCGVNEATRALEKNDLSCIIMASDVNPPEIMKHIWFACRANSIPFVIMPDFRVTIRECLGFKALCLSLKCITDDNPLQPLLKMVQDINSRFTNKDDLVLETTTIDDTVIVPEDKSDTESVNCELKLEIMKEDIYLYRNSKHRVFKPLKSENMKCINSWNYDFVAFSNIDDTLTDSSINEDVEIVNIDYPQHINKSTKNNNNLLGESGEKLGTIATLGFIPLENTESIETSLPQNVQLIPSFSDTSSKVSSINILQSTPEENINVAPLCSPHINAANNSPNQIGKRNKRNKNKSPTVLNRFLNEIQPINVSDILLPAYSFSTPEENINVAPLCSPHINAANNSPNQIGKRNKRSKKKSPTVLNRFLNKIQPMNVSDIPLPASNVTEQIRENLDSQVSLLSNKHVTMQLNNIHSITGINTSCNTRTNGDNKKSGHQINTINKMCISPETKKTRKEKGKEFNYIPTQIKRLQPNKSKRSKPKSK